MHRRVPSARCSATPSLTFGHSRPGRETTGPSLWSSARRRSWGSGCALPFAGLLPRTGGSRRFRRSGPTCRSSPSRPPRLIFVGVIRSLVPASSTCTHAGDPTRARDGSGSCRRSDFWASIPVCGPLVVTRDSAIGRPGAATSDPALGLFLFQGSRTRVRATAWARPHADHQPPARPRRPRARTTVGACWRRAATHPLVGFGRSFPVGPARRNVRRPFGLDRARRLDRRRATCVVRPFSVFEGLMPCHPRPGVRARVERLPV